MALFVRGLMIAIRVLGVVTAALAVAFAWLAVNARAPGNVDLALLFGVLAFGCFADLPRKLKAYESRVLKRS